MAEFIILRDKVDSNARWQYTKGDGTIVEVEGLYGNGHSDYVYWTEPDKSDISSSLSPSNLITALESEVGESVTFETTGARNENPVTEAEG